MVSQVTTSGFFILIATITVAIVLVLGLANMMRDGSAQTSQRLMRARVLLQALAIFAIMAVLWLRGSPGA
jgi:quinol-cytochrome oxidoreductase complex cytochrome b subunit